MKDEAVFPFWRALLLNDGEADDYNDRKSQHR